MTAILYEKEDKKEEKSFIKTDTIQTKKEKFPVKVRETPTIPKILEKTLELSKKEIKPKKISRRLRKLYEKAKYNAKYFEELKSIEEVKYNGYYNKFILY
jgi:ribosomal protein L22